MSVNKVVVLVSGMDSLIALKKAQVDYPNAEVKGVWYDLGLSFSEAERSKLPADIEIVEFHGYMDSLHQTECQGVTSYPIMYEGIVIDAVRRYQPDLLWLGVLATDSEIFIDNRLGWANQISMIFRNTRVDFPLARMNFGKKEAIEYGLEIGVDIEDIISMHTCRSKFHGEKGCGSCFSCMRKKNAIESLGYKTDIPSPKNIPVKNVAIQVKKVGMLIRECRMPHQYMRQMDEVLPLLMRTYGIHIDYEQLGETIADHYEENSEIIEDLINYGE